MLSHLFTTGTTLTFSTTYGKTSIDSSEIVSNTTVTDETSGKSLISSLNLTQSFHISHNLHLSVLTSLTHMENDLKAYTDGSGNNVAKSNNDLDYITIGAKFVGNIVSYRPYIALNYYRSNENFTTSINDKSYYRGGVGISKNFLSDYTLALNYSKMFQKSNATSNSLGVVISKKF